MTPDGIDFSILALLRMFGNNRQTWLAGAGIH